MFSVRITREHRENLAKAVHGFAGKSKEQLKRIYTDFAKRTKTEVKEKELERKASEAVSSVTSRSTFVSRRLQVFKNERYSMF